MYQPRSPAERAINLHLGIIRSSLILFDLAPNGSESRHWHCRNYISFILSFLLFVWVVQIHRTKSPRLVLRDFIMRAHKFFGFHMCPLKVASDLTLTLPVKNKNPQQTSRSLWVSFYGRQTHKPEGKNSGRHRVFYRLFQNAISNAQEKLMTFPPNFAITYKTLLFKHFTFKAIPMHRSG